MAHVMKHTRASCGHMFAHFDRRAANISNENLDRTRTHLNYNLAIHQQMDQGEFVRQRCSEVRCQNRKDVNVMVSWVVTAPKDLPEAEYKDFFKATYDFLENRYGAKNVVSAYVHMDEVTPHMHFAFVPVYLKERELFEGSGAFVYDERLSAKNVVDRNDLRTFHNGLQKYIERELGHSVSILNEATREGNKSIEELKRQSATERLQEAEKQAEAIISKANQEEQSIKTKVIMHNLEFNAKQAYMDAFNDKTAQIDAEEFKVVEKGLLRKQRYVQVPEETWKAVKMSDYEQDMIARVKDAIVDDVRELKRTTSYQNAVELSQRVEKLIDKNEKLYNAYNDVVQKHNALLVELEKAELKADKTMKKVKDVLSRLPEDVAKEFRDEWNGKRKEPEREPERETPVRHWDDYEMER